MTFRSVISSPTTGSKSKQELLLVVCFFLVAFLAYSSTMKIEVIASSETSVNFYILQCITLKKIVFLTFDPGSINGWMIHVSQISCIRCVCIYRQLTFIHIICNLKPSPRSQCVTKLAKEEARRGEKMEGINITLVILFRVPTGDLGTTLEHYVAIHIYILSAMLFRPWICACCLVTLLAHAHFSSFLPPSMPLPHLNPPNTLKLVVKQMRVSDSQNGSVLGVGVTGGGCMVSLWEPLFNLRGS